MSIENEKELKKAVKRIIPQESLGSQPVTADTGALAQEQHVDMNLRNSNSLEVTEKETFEKIKFLCRYSEAE
jgi:hypothetical protein